MTYMTLRRFLLGLLAIASCSVLQAQSSRWVDSTLASLSLEERVGQLFVVEMVALYTHQDDQAYTYAREMVTRYHVGSFILGGGSILDIPIITNRLQKLSRVPLFINGDMEAGMTYGHPWRLSRGWTERLPRFIPGGGTQFISQMGIGATGNPEYAYQFGRITALEARAAGLRWSNSPVADVNSNAENPIINTRSYGEDPALVAGMVAAYVRGAHDGGMLATLKHFPGHGDTRDDSHMKLPVLPFDLRRLDSVEFVPFKAGIDAGVGAVMTSHLALPRIDPSGRPATLSRPVLTGLLREHLGFRGVIVTDGMRMQGITDQFGPAEAAVLAIEAGVDAILGIEDIDRGYHGLLDAVKGGRITEDRINQSVRRILTAKAVVGLDREPLIDIEAMFRVVGNPAFRKISSEISDASVTLLRNDRHVIPVPPSARIRFVSVTEEPASWPGTEFVNEISSRVASVEMTRISNDTGEEKLREIVEDAQKNDVLVVGVYLSVVAWKGDRRFAPPLDHFLQNLSLLKVPVILVAFGDPYVLGKLPETAVVMTPYNGTYLAEESVARAIAGKIQPAGRLPVAIPGRYPRGFSVK